MNRAYGIVGLVVIAAAGVGIVSRSLNQGDDKTMIQETLRQALQATREGKPGGVMDALSRSLTVNEQGVDGNFGRVANYIKNQKPDIEVTNQTPIIIGDEARITSPIQIKVSLPFVGDKAIPMNDVVMVFKKETGRELLVFPVKKWRLVQVQAPSVGLDTLGLN